MVNINIWDLLVNVQKLSMVRQVAKLDLIKILSFSSLVFTITYIGYPQARILTSTFWQLVVLRVVPLRYELGL